MEPSIITLMPMFNWFQVHKRERNHVQYKEAMFVFPAQSWNATFKYHDKENHEAVEASKN